jgi:hypothetical protein
MNLRNQLPGGLTLEALEAATAEQIDACICKVGFHNTKCAQAAFCTGAEPAYVSHVAAADRANLALRAKNLKLLAERLRTHHDGDVPGDLREPLSFDGDGVLNLKLGADTLVSIHLASFAARDCRGRTQDGVPVSASDRTECASASHLVKHSSLQISLPLPQKIVD